MGLKSYTLLRDDEYSLKRKRTALINIMKSLFKVRFFVLSAGALLTLCVFAAYSTQTSSIKAMAVPAPSNILKETSKSAEESLEKEFDSVNGSCDHLLADHDIDPKAFGPVVAHSIHSLSIDDLRYYFSPDASATNNIPVVDLNLTSDTPVLDHAPSRSPSPFNSLGMRVLDQVLTHMDDNMYDVKNMNGLERVAHAMHMHEMWHNARPHFSHLKSNPANQSVCSCIVDIEGNGVMEHLRLNALKIREPEVFYKKTKDTASLHKPKYNVGYSIGYSKALSLEDSNSALKKLGEGQPKLKDSSSWLAWRGDTLPDLPRMDSNNKMLALFIHCRLKL